MNIYGYNKTTLLDYPGILAATIFTGSCNLRCPFCHNGDLVLHPEIYPLIDEKEIFDHLLKRQHILKGVCISGGEPTLQPDLCDFIKKIKALGYSIKLDTNGTNPQIIKKLISNNMIDYIAMDIKAGRDNYAHVTGVNKIDISKILYSVELIMNSNITYEFRTTAVKGLHSEDDFIDIKEMINGANAYFIQSFIERETCIDKKCSAFTKEELEHFLKIVKTNIPNSALRGID